MRTSVTKRVHIFVIVLIRPMGLLLSKRRGSSFLWRRVVIDSFHVVGVVPVSQKRMNKCRREALNEAGRSLKSSLGIPSGPGALLLRRVR